MQTLKLAAALLAVILGGFALWIWISSGNDPDLPFGYAGFD